MELFNRELGYIAVADAGKPGIRKAKEAMEKMGAVPENTMFLGDQLLTDMWGAHNAGLHKILVKPIHPKEEIQIILKRRLEKIILFFYKRRIKRLKA